ncbi:hypothetical protein Bca4012_045269 [Brassica carinata]
MQNTDSKMENETKSIFIKPYSPQKPILFSLSITADLLITKSIIKPYSPQTERIPKG